MKDQFEFAFKGLDPKEPLKPVQYWPGSAGNDPLADEMSRSDRELELLFQESQEYDFLMDRSPQLKLHNWI